MQEKFLYAFSGNLFACEQIFNEIIAHAQTKYLHFAFDHFIFPFYNCIAYFLRYYSIEEMG